MKSTADTEIDLDQLQAFAIKNPVFTAKWFSLMARLDALRHRVNAEKRSNSGASENARTVTVKSMMGKALSRKMWSIRLSQISARKT